MFGMCVSTNSLSQINRIKDRKIKNSRQQFLWLNLFLIPHLHAIKEMRWERKSLYKGPSCVEDSHTAYSLSAYYCNPTDLLFLDRTHVNKAFNELNVSTNEGYVWKILPQMWEVNSSMQEFVCMCLSMWSVVNYFQAKIWGTEILFYYFY